MRVLHIRAMDKLTEVVFLALLMAHPGTGNWYHPWTQQHKQDAVVDFVMGNCHGLMGTTWCVCTSRNRAACPCVINMVRFCRHYYDSTELLMRSFRPSCCLAMLDSAKSVCRWRSRSCWHLLNILHLCYHKTTTTTSTTMATTTTTMATTSTTMVTTTQRVYIYYYYYILKIRILH